MHLLHLISVICIKESIAQGYYKHSDVLTTVTSLPASFASNDMDCGRQCHVANCHAFYFDELSKSCILLNYINYIDMPRMTGIGAIEFFVSTVLPEPTGLPWLSCPPTPDGNVTAISSLFTLTFRITVGDVNHSEAWVACTNAGEKLMKIATAEKQAVVQYVLSTCPDFSSHEFWIDGYKNDTTGWVFADGSLVPMNKTHLWANHAPNDDNDSSGSCIRMKDGNEHRWNDQGCESKLGYICEPL